MLKAGQARLSVAAWISDPRLSVSYEMQTPGSDAGVFVCGTNPRICLARLFYTRARCDAYRQRFTIANAPHDPSTTAAMVPASETAITAPPEAASDDPSINGLRIMTIIMPPTWAATNVARNEIMIFTIQPSTPRLFVHASWIATASAATKTASAITIGPPTLESGIASLTYSSRIPTTAMSRMYGMTFVPVSHGQEYPHGSAERRLGFSRLSGDRPLPQKPIKRHADVLVRPSTPPLARREHRIQKKPAAHARLFC